MLLLLSPFFERHRVVLNKGTDGCVESTFVIPQDGCVTKYGISFDLLTLSLSVCLSDPQVDHLGEPEGRLVAVADITPRPQAAAPGPDQPRDDDDEGFCDANSGDKVEAAAAVETSNPSGEGNGEGSAKSKGGARSKKVSFGQHVREIPFSPARNSNTKRHKRKSGSGPSGDDTKRKTTKADKKSKTKRAQNSLFC